MKVGETKGKEENLQKKGETRHLPKERKQSKRETCQEIRR